MAASRVDTLQSVELADGVEIHLRVAGPVARSMAFSLDLLIRLGIDLVVWITLVLAVFPTIGPEYGRGLGLLFMFLMEWFYNVLFELGPKGATPGQRCLKLRVMSVTGGPITPAQALMRNFLRFVDFMPLCYVTGILCMLFTKRFQRLGDLVANTVVTYADQAVVQTPASEVRAERRPPPIVLSREEQAALMQFLERAPLWSEGRRIELSDLTSPLTQAEGQEGLRKLCGMALWLQEPEEKRAAPPPLFTTANPYRT